MIASLNKVGYLDAMDAAAIEFEQLLEQLSFKEAGDICNSVGKRKKIQYRTKDE
ncbi:hypothetical protein V3851_16360 [Paenibacillus sp. M1]|uniref:Uncharacterized protein n=1 Tax=Paenibacillus haidiansis TaxID=1574488 RepID=A0ABU7VUG1_9BACL